MVANTDWLEELYRHSERKKKIWIPDKFIVCVTGSLKFFEARNNTLPFAKERIFAPARLNLFKALVAIKQAIFGPC